MSAHQLNSKNKSTVSLFKTIFSTRWNSFLSSVVTDGDDGHGLKTEKNWANFSVIFPLIFCRKKLPKTWSVLPI